MYEYIIIRVSYTHLDVYKRQMKRWVEDVDEDLKNIGIIRWRRICSERAEWRKLSKRLKPILGCNANKRRHTEAKKQWTACTVSNTLSQSPPPHLYSVSYFLVLFLCIPPLSSRSPPKSNTEPGQNFRYSIAQGKKGMSLDQTNYKAGKHQIYDTDLKTL